MSFAGFRLFVNRMALSRRRRARYRRARRAWEAAFAAGRIDATELQAGYAAAEAITAHADAAAWHRGELARAPPVDA